MKIKTLFVSLLALLTVALCPAQMIQVNYNGTGLVYCNNPGQTEIGNAPTKAITWSGLQTFTGGVSIVGGTIGFTSANLTTPVIIGGLTASGSGANDFSASTGTFKTSTGVSTFGGSSNSFTNSVAFAGGLTASGANANDFSGGSGIFKTSTGAATFGGATNTFTNGLQVGSGVVQHLYNAQSTATQTPAATTRTYIAGSGLTITAAQIQVGTIIRWHFNMTKTAAGSATSTFDIAFGTAGTTADTARVSFTKPAGTAAADEGFADVECIVKTNSASGVVVGEFRMIHNLAATGHAVIPCVVVQTTSGTFDTTTVTNIGLCITSGASDAITINQVSTESVNL